MSLHRARILLVVSALTSVMLFTTSAFGQSPAMRPNSIENRIAADGPKPKDLQSEVEAVKADNAAVRELLRKMEEQQKALLERLDRLQRRLDGSATTDLSMDPPIGPPATADASAPAANTASNAPPAEPDSASTSTQPAAVAATQP